MKSKYLANIDIGSRSTLKIYRQQKTPKIENSKIKSKPNLKYRFSTDAEGEYRENEFKIQMISKNLYEQIFVNKNRLKLSNNSVIQKHFDVLHKHGININGANIQPDIQLKIPPLKGKNIEDHFRIIAHEQIQPYENLLNSIINYKNVSLPPTQWNFQEGWTRYDTNGQFVTVDYPTENELIIDVEVCMSAGNIPTLATAVSSQYWYSWVSAQLIFNLEKDKHRENSLEDLIPLGRKEPKIIIGHNVSYDRARLREQYLIEDTKTRFLDTMSLHTCVSGSTSYQRAIMKSKKEHSPDDLIWMEKSSANSLADVYRLYCNGTIHSKESRNIFVKGNLEDIRNDFQNLMTYCANDVIATRKVIQKLYPLFKKRFSHPVTLAGMLELGSAYLPVNSNWLRYINESNLAYEDLNIEAKYHLGKRANEACRLLNNDEYKNNLWLWDEDWSVQELKFKKMKSPKSKCDNNANKYITNDYKIDNSAVSPHEKTLFNKFKYLYDMKPLLPARRPLLPGYPAWYRKLCQKPSLNVNVEKDWFSGAPEIRTGMTLAPKLLSMCWEGFPLHYTKEHGWGFLVPFRSEHLQDGKIPIKQLSICCPVPKLSNISASVEETEYALNILHNELDKTFFNRQFNAKLKIGKNAMPYNGSGIWCNHILEDCCYFFKLPHKNGPSYRVGNPLSKDFINKFSENVLSTGDNGKYAKRIIEIARMISYWRNNRDRISEQMVVWLNDSNIKEKHNTMQYGVICPQVVVCGTLTRRAMEPTWMTASNSQHERIGSELRAMVQAPKSYKIVGADVDSQELWIASILGDAYSCGTHGATPLGWMTISGSKSNGTDMHSITAKAIGISRDHAKVINYARIYGAGQNFAEGLLKQFNPTYSDSEAKEKSKKMFCLTKGKKTYEIRNEFRDQYENRSYSGYEARKISLNCNRTVDEMFYKPFWKDGTESAMFNRLEEIALKTKPVTPFLGCRLSRPLEGETDSAARFLPTRVNWVVQSGAVDFLHLMLVAMRWLMGSNVRFCLSFHDEIRYLAKDEMAYKAALAMHITNLLTRSYCASRLGLDDLPMSVAFFSSVEVDTVLRKDCEMNCKTPSNPHGLKIGYGISNGESLNIQESIEKAGGGDITQWSAII